MPPRSGIMATASTPRWQAPQNSWDSVSGASFLGLKIAEPSPVSRSFAMACFSSNTEKHAIEPKLPVDQRGGAVATEAVARFIAVDVAPSRLFEVWRRIENVSNGPIQPVNCRVIDGLDWTI